ncbi:hypothetical protein OFM15_30115, partial [Escherichia coli]|nr:hypothetical protein [Escherichia coli]
MQAPTDANVHAVACDAMLPVAGKGALYPDHVVYLGSSPLLAAPASEATAWLNDFRDRSGQLPNYLVIPGTGVLLGPKANRSVA